ncbi:MAG: hypothetical protein JSS84_07265 [Bacteroidetes bacterium]|nr:hypothetical protein [Bacteroidota bacterium]
MKDAAEAMRGLVNDIRGDMGLPPLPQVLPLASSIWQGRTVAGAFEQLEHEAHYCLLSFLIDSAAEVEGYRRKQYRRLKGYRPELNDYMSTLGNQRRELAGQWYHAGGSPHYGLTLTNLGAKSGPLTQRWERWAEGFAEEVRAAFVAHGQGEQAAKEVGRLASGIAQLSIGNAERTAYEERLELARQDLSNRGQYAAPGDIAAMFQGHIKGFKTWRGRLVERVGSVVSSATDTNNKEEADLLNIVGGDERILTAFGRLLKERRITNDDGNYIRAHNERALVLACLDAACISYGRTEVPTNGLHIPLNKYVTGLNATRCRDWRNFKTRAGKLSRYKLELEEARAILDNVRG